MPNNKVSIVFEVDNTGAIRSFTQVDDGLEKIEKQTKRTDTALSGMSKHLAGIGTGLIAAFTVDRVVAFAQETFSAAREVENFAQRAGFGAERVQLMGEAAKKFGIDAGDARDFLVDFNFEVGDAIKNGGIVAEKFKDWGISIKNLNGTARENEAILKDVIAKVQELSSSQERAAFIGSVFGEDNQKLIPIFLEGNEALEQLNQLLKDQGVILEDDVLKNLSAADKAFRDITTSVKGLGQSLVVDLAPGIVETTPKIQAMIEATLREYRAIENFGATIKEVASEGLSFWRDKLFDGAEAAEETTAETEKLKKELEPMPEIYGRLSDGSIIYKDSLIEITENTKEATQAHREFERQLEAQQRALKRGIDFNRQLANELKQVGLEGKELAKARLEEDIDRRARQLAETGDIDQIEKGEKLLGELQKKRLAEIEKEFDDSQSRQEETAKSTSEKIAESAKEDWKEAAREGVGAFKQELENGTIERKVTELAGFAKKSFVDAFVDSFQAVASFNASGRSLGSPALRTISQIQREDTAVFPAQGRVEALKKISRGELQASQPEIQDLIAQINQAVMSTPGGIPGVARLDPEKTLERVLAGSFGSSVAGFGKTTNVINTFNIAATDAASFLDQQTVNQIADTYSQGMHV